ncbi:hypothetical protein [Pseudomonas moorei]|uniref:hypothetical protein n=1 Tax=Pseudomonas moorei TaxID=395599 RepID=UPI001FF286B2|nr:hypothetical protein [Pseudomonas moorei]
MARQVVLLDNCVWDLLMAKEVDLLVEQGEDLSFRISDLGEIEIPDAEHEREKARAVGVYARSQMARLGAEPVQWFSFAGDQESSRGTSGLGDLIPDGTIVGGGFLADLDGQAYSADSGLHKRVGGASGVARTNSGLLKNQTDVDYGEWSFGLPVVTANPKDFKNAGRIIRMDGWTSGGFGDFVRRELLKGAVGG